eukprot:PhF_6_TR19530/c0_g1_i2/m.28501
MVIQTLEQCYQDCTKDNRNNQCIENTNLCSKPSSSPRSPWMGQSIPSWVYCLFLGGMISSFDVVALPWLHFLIFACVVVIVRITFWIGTFIVGNLYTRPWHVLDCVLRVSLVICLAILFIPFLLVVLLLLVAV